MKKIMLILSVLVLAGCSQQGTETNSQTQELDGEAAISQETMQENGADEDGAMMNSEEIGDQAEEVTVNSYALAEVEQHGDETDCWIAIEGKVYDVTAFIESGNHGGGDAILMGCGKDATDLYNDRPNGSGAHSDKARSFLPNFYIGDLTE